RQQTASMVLLAAVRRISEDFVMLKEARREVLQDQMDIDNAEKIITAIEEKKIKIREVRTDVPSPFAFNLVAQGYSDIMKMEDKAEFLKRMHQMVLAKVALKEGKEKK
ncbi:MAG: ATP-dependent helicase, partial [Nanoarchaeota archaeon]|nr:ATP-dependent helicase [Nanoarchaeota archaeon]